MSTLNAELKCCALPGQLLTMKNLDIKIEILLTLLSILKNKCDR